MKVLIRRFTVAAVTALFCTAAISSTLTSTEGDVASQASDNPWLEVSSESMSQAPLLLAGSTGSKKVKGSKKNYVFYCKVKYKDGVIKSTKTKKAKDLAKATSKINKCNNKAPKYQCFIDKCENSPSFS